MTAFTHDSPQAALDAILERTSPVEVETVALADAIGRVLREGVPADRDSPSCDVSAMDGFALRAADATAPLPIAGAIVIGTKPPPLAPGTALRIVTGAAIPHGADVVVRHEDTTVDAGLVRATIAPRGGDNIRRRAENVRSGAEVVAAGTRITPAVSAALATFGAARVKVCRRVRVAIVTTGDEVVPVDATPDEWHVRDGNGSSLVALFGAMPCATIAIRAHVADDEATLRDEIARAIDGADVVFLTGGVSMGERDFIPATLARLGATTLFHKLPQRPGKPLLAAIARGGQPILALPGNPLSVLVTARRFGVATVERLAGAASARAPLAVAIDSPDHATIPLWWHRPVRLVAPGRARLVTGRGSGDVASAATSDGFVELPPGGCGPGPWPFLPWSA
ncbi:MAG: molybdopterin molybdotransferase MoeA [Phycisphaerales bacterium]